jgi:hypothetical protein
MSTETPPFDPAVEAPGDDASFEALDRLLAEARIEVRPDFSRQVMSALPQPRWARVRSREWLAVAAVAATLMVAATLLLGGSGSDLGPVAAVTDLFLTAFAAGAGFLTASWSGIGRTVDAALGGSVPALLGVGVAAVGAFLVLARLLRRRRQSVRSR